MDNLVAPSSLVLLLTGVLFVIIGLAVKHFKLYDLMAGYNTMSPEEKEKVNIEKLSTLFRDVFVIMGVLMILGYLTFSFLENPNMGIIFYISVTIVGVLYLVIRGNSRAYKNES